MSAQTEFPTLYYYDINRRVYEMNGVKQSAPFEEGYYVQIKVVSETDKEYICEYGTVNKKKMLYSWGRHKMRVLTEKEKQDGVFIAENRHKIADRLRRLGADALRQVEQILIENGL